MTTFRFGDFEWDEAKARANLRKHGVSFSEAARLAALGGRELAWRRLGWGGSHPDW